MSGFRLPYSGAHWVDHVARHAHSRPDAVALRFDGVSTTWRELDDRIRRLATGLSARGVVKGDRVAVLMTNRPEFAEAVLAANLLGAIAVPVNFRLAPQEVTHLLADSGATVLITDAMLAALARIASKAAARSVRIIVTGLGPASDAARDDGDDADDGESGDVESYEGILAGTEPHPPQVQIDERDIALIMYTSGTTGLPKGAMLTHLNLLMQTITAIRTSRLVRDDEIGLINVPLFHIAGIGNLSSPLLSGSVTVIMPTAPFTAESTLDVVESEGVTGMFLVPAQWQVLCAHPEATRRTRSLRRIGWGAAPATVTLLETMAKTFPHAEITSLFGQTEMSPVTVSLRSEDAIRKIGSVGKPVPTVPMRIVDEFMNDVTPGEIGEIVYRGPTVMAGYWNNPAATAEAFAGGWFHSGDLVRQDDEGFIYVVDRKKDMIVSGGENIYSAEVENALAGHPGIADVAVIGARHQRWGETPVAVVVPADPAFPPTLDELTGWLRDRLASYKKPTALVLVDELPRSAAGKVLKHELRRKYGEAHYRE
jgi:fatty-acyl-CoA synthase